MVCTTDAFGNKKRPVINSMKAKVDPDANRIKNKYENTELFSASFYEGGVEGEFLTDQGSDVNLIPLAILTPSNLRTQT